MYMERKRMKISIAQQHSCTHLFISTSFFGSGLDRGQRPVEWGDFPYVRTSIRPYVRTSVPPSGPSSHAWLAGPQAWLAGLKAWLDGPGERTDERMDGRTDGKSPHSTGLRPLSGPLPCLPP